MNKVLIVDDEPSILDLVGEYLSDEGYFVLTAANGLEGLDVYKRHEPEIIITDLQMAKMGGLELIKALDLGSKIATSVIVLTGYGTNEEVRQCYKLGVQSFLRKPVALYELGGLVRRGFELISYANKLEIEILEKNRILDSLAKKHRILKKTFNAMVEGVITLNTSFRVSMISSKACRILDVEELQALEVPAVKLLGAEVASPHGLIGQCVSSEMPVNELDVQIFSMSGRIIPVTLSIQVLEDEGWLLIFRDRREEEKTLLEVSQGFSFGRMVSCDDKMKAIFSLIEKVASSNATVLVTGESGTGKELVSREIHDRSRRAQKPFHAVNCAAISPELLESEFFGHEKGAFTGAIQAKPGRFELSHGGTLFLDEVGEIPLKLQGKLLRALQEKSFERVGGTKLIHVDVRIIAATNQNLMKMVEEKTFREDLYYRLHVVPITLPPLRDRLQDVPILVSTFIKQLNEKEGRSVANIMPTALQMLMEHSWPGNIRELYNAIEYAFAVSKGRLLEEGHLPELFGAKIEITSDWEENAPMNERELTLQALQQTNFNRTKAAALLGINRSTLYRRQKKYNLF